MRLAKALSIVLLLFASTGVGQVSVHIIDDLGLPLHQAHIAYSDPTGTDNGMILTNAEGIAELPAAFTKHHKEVVISITFIGFQGLTDTVATSLSALEYQLSPEDQLLNQFVVTAQYAPNSPEKAVHKVRIIDEAKIERMAAVNLEDVLTNEVNIRISQDAVLGSSISMQGMSGEKVKIMIDGVPMIGRQNGNLDLNQINLNNIERIEIIEGPLSVNYGTSALAGTINLITKKESKEKTSASISSYYESIGTYNIQGTVAQQFGKARLSLNGGRNFFDGWNPDDAIGPDFEDPIADSTRFKRWKPREQLFGRAQLNYRWKELLLGYRFDYFDEKITNRGRPRAPYMESAFDDYYYTTRIDNSVTASGKISKSINANFVAGYNQFTRQKNTYAKNLVTLEEGLHDGDGAQDTSTFNLWMSRGSVAFVRDSSWIHWEIGYDLNHETATGRRIEDTEQAMGDYAVFTTAEITPWESFTVRPGLRYSYNTAYTAPVTPSLNAIYRLKKWTIRGSYARGFRAPSLKELHFFFVDINHNIVGNPDLKAEQSDNYSLSVKRPFIFKQNIVQLEFGAFHNDIENLISLALTDPETDQYRNVNIGRSRSQGMNAAVSVMHEHLKTNLAFAYLGVNNAIANEQSSSVYDYYPEVTANATYSWPRAGLDLSLFYKYQGRLPITSLDDNDELYQRYVDAYHTLDATLTRSFLDQRILFSVGAKNLLDVQNVGFSGTSNTVHGSSSGALAVSTGRLYFLKLDLRWQR